MPQTFSLDMVRSNATDCVLKCAFSFKYKESNIQVANERTLLRFTLDDTTNSPSVMFDGKRYSPSSFTIRHPSIHTFNNVRPAGEMVITHVSENTNSKSLVVYIPIILSTSASESSEILTSLIQYSTQHANNSSSNQSSTLNYELSLQPMIPKTSFYYYTTATSNVIVFDALNGIGLRSAVINALQQIITATTPPTTTGYATDELFYNPNGPTKEYIGDGIYISCRPTGSSDEKTAVTYDAKPTFADVKGVSFGEYSYYFTQGWITIVLCILFVVFIYLFNFLYGYLTTDKSLVDYIRSSVTFSFWKKKE